MLKKLQFYDQLACPLKSSGPRTQMKRWESWEAETRTLEYQFSYDPRRFQLTYQTSFGKRHLKCWSDNRLLRWPASFVRQFFNSVSKSDYFTLRHGFIMAHFAEGSHFNFQKYIRRNLEKDFGVVMGISWWIWLFSVFVIFFNAHVASPSFALHTVSEFLSAGILHMDLVQVWFKIMLPP
ncbi:hypothetical protein L3X38_021795 [Prunus dulcis]|uniref:Uncharacterized protein n=1 Tax=Prunus dulcis TaxID=3755 RepID=A0AAD4VWD7_PRUDU|nr:hypothetical protein L3X38_021795 [Prunus dulcis]